jgi:hypothetical protein
MATEVSLKSGSTGEFTFYSNYADARGSAGPGDVIFIWADLDEQIVLLDGVDICIAPGRILDMTDEYPTITDNGEKCVCNIFGEGIIKNSYTGSAKQSCINISDNESEIYIECDYMVGLGGTDANTIAAPTMNIIHAAKFIAVCNNIYNLRNSAIAVSDCNNFYVKCKRITSGTFDTMVKNSGAPVIYLDASGCIYADEVICDGYGSCIRQRSGIVLTEILKITARDNSTASHPVIDVGDIGGEQDLILNFDELQNLNTNDGDAVKITDGKATLKGRRIFSKVGLSMELGADANINCTEIISEQQGVEIHNSSEQKVIIDSDYIEGNVNNNGVIYSYGYANYLIRNAKIKNSDTSSSSIGMYIDEPDSQNITLKNVIVVTGNITSGETIYAVNPTMEFFVYNYGLFLNKEATYVNYFVGDDNNYKVVVDSDIT